MKRKGCRFVEYYQSKAKEAFYLDLDYQDKINDDGLINVGISKQFGINK